MLRIKGVSQNRPIGTYQPEKIGVNCNVLIDGPKGDPRPDLIIRTDLTHPGQDGSDEQLHLVFKNVRYRTSGCLDFFSENRLDVL